MNRKPARYTQANKESQPPGTPDPTESPPQKTLPSKREGGSSYTLFVTTATVMILAICGLLFLSGSTFLGGVEGADGKIQARDRDAKQDVLRAGKQDESYKAACPDYRQYSTTPHRPLSKGPLALPYQRPAPQCRTFNSPAVELVIQEVTSRMTDKDLARIFENAFPNTLDTTVRWHVDGTEKHGHQKYYQEGAWEGPQSFIVTGDINAEWLRDSTNQLAQYQRLTKKDENLSTLILGAINTQVEYVIESPYCNAFQPPPPSGEPIPSNGQEDIVHPAYEASRVFECKYELDSLAHFLNLANTYYEVTGSTAFLTRRYYLAIETILETLEQQAMPTFNETTGRFQGNVYGFQRLARAATETLSLGGIGNPLAPGTGLIRSAFRPSDDATVFGFFIPANAQMAVELKRTASMLEDQGSRTIAPILRERGESIEKGVWEHGVVSHKKYGDVFAFEVDGYGSSIIMDDANSPSLLALPRLGFVDRNHEIYKNTRKMILERKGNPYFLEGRGFSGIGGPHVGPQYAWPMSRLVQAMTSDDDVEIMSAINDVRNVSKLGLINESVNVQRPADVTRTWFAWANSVFAQTILDIAERKPHLIFGKDAQPYKIQ